MTEQDAREVAAKRLLKAGIKLQTIEASCKVEAIRWYVPDEKTETQIRYEIKWWTEDEEYKGVTCAVMSFKGFDECLATIDMEIEARKI